MTFGIRNRVLWPALLAQFQNLTDWQLAKLCRIETGRLQVAWFMVQGALAPPDDGGEPLRKRVARVMTAPLS